MGCIVGKLEWCVIAKCCHCIHLRLGCFIVATIAIVFWIGIIVFFLFDEGTGVFNNSGRASWAARAYVTVILCEAAARVIISTVLIFGAALKRARILSIFLVVWIVLVILVLGDLIFAIAISRLDGATIVFGFAYAVGRFLFGVLAVVIVNSYRIQLINENHERELHAKSSNRTSPEFVL